MYFADLKQDDPQAAARPDGVVLEAVVGSRAYGLAWEASDTDRLGVFMAPSTEFFGLDDIQESRVSTDPDVALHELGKMCRLLLKVNPTVTELLWLDSYLVLTDVGLELIQLREAFLSAPYCRNAFLGYATSQFGKLKDRGDGSFSADLRHRTAKHARHLSRLLVCGFGLWSTGELRVRLDDPQWFHEFGEQVADGDVGAAEVLLAEYEGYFNDTPTMLPEQPDRPRVDAWLKATRAAALESVNST